MAIRLLTEDGRLIRAETAAGIPGASSLNDTRVETINHETFTTDPLSNDWLIGDAWEWNAGNGNMQMA